MSVGRTFIGILILLAASLACSSTDSGGTGSGPASCTPGESKACACTTGASGSQTCSSSGTFATCVCDATDAGTDAGTTPLGAPCTNVLDCDALFQAVTKAGLMNNGLGNPMGCGKNALGESVCTFACNHLGGSSCGTGNCSYYPIPGAEPLCTALGGQCASISGVNDQTHCWLK